MYRDILGNPFEGCEYDCDVEIRRRLAPNTRQQTDIRKCGSIFTIKLIFSHTKSVNVEMVYLDRNDIQMLHHCCGIYQDDDRYKASSANLDVNAIPGRGIRLSTRWSQSFLDGRAVDRLFAALRVKDFLDRFDRLESVSEALCTPSVSDLTAASALLVMKVLVCDHLGMTSSAEEIDGKVYRRTVKKLMSHDKYRAKFVSDAKMLYDRVKDLLNLTHWLHPRFYMNYADFAQNKDNKFIERIRFWPEEYLFVRGVWNRYFRYNKH